jgi:hypothetical protein
MLVPAGAHFHQCKCLGLAVAMELLASIGIPSKRGPNWKEIVISGRIASER